jgi:hypothetical protein
MTFCHMFVEKGVYSRLIKPSRLSYCWYELDSTSKSIAMLQIMMRSSPINTQSAAPVIACWLAVSQSAAPVIACWLAVFSTIMKNHHSA